MWIALLRHGISEWNERGLIQGHTDTSLSAEGISRLKKTAPCAAFLRARWFASPLKRARQTAELLHPDGEICTADALIETNWGEFEGSRRADLPRRIRELNLRPASGLDFCPPGGESARMVQKRLLPFLQSCPRPAVLVTHKGVLRGAISLACDWDMVDEFWLRVDWSLPQVFRLDGGKLRMVKLNCGWGESPDDPAGGN